MTQTDRQTKTHIQREREREREKHTCTHTHTPTHTHTTCEVFGELQEKQFYVRHYAAACLVPNFSKVSDLVYLL